MRGVVPKLYLLLVLYGAIMWGAQDQIRHRPGWAQWGMLLLWAGIACPFFLWLSGDSSDKEE